MNSPPEPPSSPAQNTVERRGLWWGSGGGRWHCHLDRWAGNVLLQVGRSGCWVRVHVREAAAPIACRNLLIGAASITARGHIAPMGVVGGVLAHRMVGVSGWKDVQLPTVLSAALAHSQGNNIDDGECNQNTDQHQQGNAPARNPRLERGRGREGHISHTNTRDVQVISGSFFAVFKLCLHLVGISGTISEGQS